MRHIYDAVFRNIRILNNKLQLLHVVFSSREMLLDDPDVWLLKHLYVFIKYKITNLFFKNLENLQSFL